MQFLAGAERESRRRLGRPLTAEELVRVLRRYPGDIVIPAPKGEEVGNGEEGRDTERSGGGD